MPQQPYQTLRVYRDDNYLYEESEHVAVVDNRDCYLVDLVHVRLPEWDNATIRFLKHTWTSDPGLLNHTTSALAGWHYLFDASHITKVLNWHVVEQHQPAEVVIEQTLSEEAIAKEKEPRFQLASAFLALLLPLPEYKNENPPYPKHFPQYLTSRFTADELRRGIAALKEGKTVEFRYREWGSV